MSAEMNVEAAREVVKCWNCRLIQFSSAARRCKRCRVSFDPDPEPETSPASSPPPEPETDSVGMSVSRLLREYRTKAGLSQQRLARIIGVPRTYVSKVENRVAIPNLSNLYRFAEALDLNPGDLVEDEPTKRIRESAEILADPFLRPIAEAYHQLDDTQRASILADVRARAHSNFMQRRNGHGFSKGAGRNDHRRLSL